MGGSSGDAKVLGDSRGGEISGFLSKLVSANSEIKASASSLAGEYKGIYTLPEREALSLAKGVPKFAFISIRTVCFRKASFVPLFFMETV